VQALTGTTVIEDVSSKLENKRFGLFIGEPSIVVAEEGTVSAGISQTCWLVETNTSKANERAAAEWLIGVAMSLLRLTSFSELGQLAPDRGAIEPNPISNPPGDFIIAFDDERFTLPGVRVLPRYVAGEAVRTRASGEPFTIAAQDIFQPGSGSLGERFQRCLGWQAKARKRVTHRKDFCSFSQHSRPY
jgi:hypothetical protein